MDHSQIEALARDIEDLKRAVKRNAPLMQDIFDLKGWDIFSLVAGVLVSVFTLGAHVLCAAYGSFGLIPAPWQAGLWALLALTLVGAAVTKFLMVASHSHAGTRYGLRRVMKALCGGMGKHLYFPFLALIPLILVFALQAGHPWLAASAIALLLGLWCNVFAFQYNQRPLLFLGYWGLATGAASLWWIEAAPFLWSFIIYGGMFFVFAGAMRLLSRPAAGERA